MFEKYKLIRSRKVFPKTPFEAGPTFSWSLSGLNETKLSVTLFISQVLGSVLFLMLKVSFQNSGVCRKQNFEIVLRFKSHIAVSIFAFYFLSSPNLSLFSPRFSVFLNAGH